MTGYSEVWSDLQGEVHPDPHQEKAEGKLKKLIKGQFESIKLIESE